MGVPLNPPFWGWIFHYKPSSYGAIPIYGNLHIVYHIPIMVDVFNFPNLQREREPRSLSNDAHFHHFGECEVTTSESAKQPLRKCFTSMMSSLSRHIGIYSLW